MVPDIFAIKGRVIFEVAGQEAQEESLKRPAKSIGKNDRVIHLKKKSFCNRGPEGRLQGLRFAGSLATGLGKCDNQRGAGFGCVF